MTAEERARQAFQAAQRKAQGQHSIGVTAARGPSSGTSSMLGTTPTSGPYGKGLTSATPTVAPQPFDPVFEAQKLGAQWNVGLARSEGTYQQGQLAYNSGFNADGSVNTANPYSQAMLLQDSYKRGVTGTNNSLAAQGQLYSGARLNAQATNDRNYAQGYDALKRATADQYHGIGVNQLTTYGQNALGVSDADYQSLRRAIYGS